MRSLASIVMKEIENQIEDKVVPVISSIMGSGRARERDRDRDRDSKSRLESYENGEESPQYSDSTNERSPEMRIPYIQDEKGFI